MLLPKKVIPSLAIAMLQLTGVGCSGDSGGSGGTGGSGASGGSGGSGDLEASLRAYCMKIAECYGASYNVDQCVSYYGQYLAGLYNYSTACVNAYASYFSCAGSLTCEQFVIDGDMTSPELDACFDSAQMAINAACSFPG